MKEKVEMKRGPGRPRKKEDEKEHGYGNIMSFVAVNGRGSCRPKVVHSPPRKSVNGNAEGSKGDKSSEEAEETADKEGNVQDGENEKASIGSLGESEEKGDKKERQTSRGEEEKGKKEKGEGKGQEEGEERSKEKERQSKEEKTGPSESDIEKMLMKERIKVIECEVLRMKEGEGQERIGRLEEAVIKLKRENEEEKERWRREREELIGIIKGYKKELEEMAQRGMKEGGGEGRGGEEVTQEGGEKGNRERGRERREEDRQQKCQGGGRKERPRESGGKEGGFESRKTEGREQRNKGEGNRQKKEQNNNLMAERGRGERNEREKKMGCRTEKPQGVSEDLMRYELKERKERRRGVIITRRRETEDGNGEENMIQFVCEKLGIGADEIIIKYEGEQKANIEFAKMEDKIEALKNKGKLRGSSIWIEDDHTRREIYIQKWLREVARKERRMGRNARVGYQKLTVGSRVWRFNEKIGQLEEMKFRGEAEGSWKQRHT